MVPNSCIHDDVKIHAGSYPKPCPIKIVSAVRFSCCRSPFKYVFFLRLSSLFLFSAFLLFIYMISWFQKKKCCICNKERKNMENLLKNELFTHVSAEELEKMIPCFEMTKRSFGKRTSFPRTREEKIISACCFRGQFLSTASA